LTRSSAAVARLAVEPLVVDLEQGQRLFGISSVIVASWRTCATSRTRRRMRFAMRGVPRAPRDLLAHRPDLDAEDARGAVDDRFRARRVVVVETEREANRSRSGVVSKRGRSSRRRA